jgi:replicative DNA helicase
MPTIEDLKYEIRDKVTLDKLYAIESIDVDADSYMLLQYLKNEYTQQEILKELQGYVESSIAFEDAEEAIGHLHQIVLDVETKVDLQDPSESMQSITLHEKDEDIAKYIPLGLNTEYDYDIQFSPRDLVMVGGKRGSGKSIVSCNIANSVYESGKTAIYFTIEMDSRSILQRCCSIATEVPFSRIRTKNLSITEWEKVATWWANRFLNGQEKLKQYREERMIKSNQMSI